MEDNNKSSDLSENTNIDFSDIIQKIIAQLPSDPIELKQLINNSFTIFSRSYTFS